jgi:hypothetical protein
MRTLERSPPGVLRRSLTVITGVVSFTFRDAGGLRGGAAGRDAAVCEIVADDRSSIPRTHRRRHHVPRHRRVEPGAAARTALIGTAGAVVVSAAFGLGQMPDDPETSAPAGSSLDGVFHERADQAVSRGALGRAPAPRVESETRPPQPDPPAPPPAPPAPDGCDSYADNRLLGCTLLLELGFDLDQMPALDALWTRESGWNHQAENPYSGAYGIPQALPGSKMVSAGDDWQTNPATQIRWGLGYIQDRYGDPAGAWAFFQANGWY